MSKNRKITSQEFDYLSNLEPCLLKTDREGLKNLKYTMLTAIEDVFSDKWYNLKQSTRQAIDYICFLSIERGFIYASPDHIAEKHGIARSTVYDALKALRDKGVIYKANRCSRKQNGLGCAVHFFTIHPYFSRINNYLGLEWKAEEKAEQKAENPEIPTKTKTLSDSEGSTYNLPVLDQDQNRHIQTNVSRPLNHNLVVFVPKEINDIYAKMFGSRLRMIWVKITQAFKTLRQNVLSRADVLTIGANIIKRLLQIWKERMREGKDMTLDAMCAFAYKSARETFFNTLGELHNDYHQERNISDARSNMTLELPVLHESYAEATNDIPAYEKIFFKHVNPTGSYSEMKEHVINCLRFAYPLIDDYSMSTLIGSYDQHSYYSDYRNWIKSS